MFHRSLAVVIAAALSGAGPALAQMVLSEIMFNPAGNERYDEFVELYNFSASDTIELEGWLLSDSSGFGRILAAPGGGSRLAPRSYGLILVPGYYANSTLYAGRIPAGALLLTIDKAQFGSYGLNNSRPERVSLHRPDSSLAAAHAYTVPNEEGFSEEKLRLEGGDGADNWGESTVLHGTPGFANSVTPMPVDSTLALMVINEIMANPAAGEAEWIECYNRGDETVRLTGWRISDSDTLKKRLLVREEVTIPPQGYLVLTGEESLLSALPAQGCTGVVVSDWPALNSAGDGVVLYDVLGRMIDAVWYTEEWGGRPGHLPGTAEPPGRLFGAQQLGLMRGRPRAYCREGQQPARRPAAGAGTHRGLAQSLLPGRGWFRGPPGHQPRAAGAHRPDQSAHFRQPRPAGAFSLQLRAERQPQEPVLGRPGR